MKVYPFQYYEPKIGEIFKFSDDNESTYKCVKAPEDYNYEYCPGCALDDSFGYYHENTNRYCRHMLCRQCQRKDNEDVYYVEE